MPELVKLKHDTVSRRVIVMPVRKDEETEESPEKDVAKKAENAKLASVTVRLEGIRFRNMPSVATGVMRTSMQTQPMCQLW